LKYLFNFNTNAKILETAVALRGVNVDLRRRNEELLLMDLGGIFRNAFVNLIPENHLIFRALYS
jgi:hypothetical protein